jgi:multidrug efflux system outer membrane protein
MRAYLNNISFAILFLGILWLVSACKVGPNYKSPEVNTPEDYYFRNNFSADSAELLWWTLYEDEYLLNLIETALSNNQNLLIAAQNIEQARAFLKIQKADLYPSLVGQGAYSKTNTTGLGKLDENIDIYSATGNLNWELDIWGRIRRLNESARAELLATEYGYRFLQIELITEVATLYMQLIEFRSSLDIARETLESRDSTVELIRERFEGGISPEIDLNQAEIQRAIAASAVPQFERLVALTEHALSILIGENPRRIESKTVFLDTLITPEIPIGLPSELLRRRPDILESEQLLMAQNAQIGAAQAARFPRLSLDGLLGYNGTSLEGFISSSGFAWSGGATLVAPIFEWGKNKRRVEVERFRTQASLYQYELTILQAFRDVEDALVQIETFTGEVEARMEHVRSARNAERLSAERYDQGVTSYLEFLESQRQAFDAQLFLVNAKQELLSSYIRLYRALGGGWITQNDLNSIGNE